MRAQSSHGMVRVTGVLLRLPLSGSAGFTLFLQAEHVASSSSPVLDSAPPLNAATPSQVQPWRWARFDRPSRGHSSAQRSGALATTPRPARRSRRGWRRIWSAMLSAAARTGALQVPHSAPVPWCCSAFGSAYSPVCADPLLLLWQRRRCGYWSRVPRTCRAAARAAQRP
jgi:hypothetical protein